jgi:SAM-dependent methyltransferase
VLRRKREVPEAEGTEGQGHGMLSRADQEVPRRREGASVRKRQEKRQVKTPERSDGSPDRSGERLPDHYATVAQDLIDFCGTAGGRVWVDLGSGEGGVALALLERLPDSIMVLVDPNAKALSKGLRAAWDRGFHGRVVAVVGTAERIPMPDGSADVVVSRGSFYFWKDRAQGLREVLRILRPGGRAMIGGGLGSRYPEWARREFIRRKRESAAAKGPEAAREFAEARSPETFRRFAVGAGLPAFEVIGEGGLGPDDADAGVGIWVRFTKEAGNAR